MKKTCDPRAELLTFALGVEMTDAEILDAMKTAKHWREQHQKKACVVCTIGGFNDDRRDLHEIPEVRAFCRRLIDKGLVSYLEYCTGLEDLFDNPKPMGAIEVIMVSEGVSEITQEDLNRMRLVVMASNRVADVTLGPLR